MISLKGFSSNQFGEKPFPNNIEFLEFIMEPIYWKDTKEYVSFVSIRNS